MHLLGEADIANPRVELQPLHDFEVHFVDHVPARHLSLSCRLNFRGFRMVFGVWTRAKYVPAFLRAKEGLSRRFCAKMGQVPGQERRLPCDKSSWEGVSIGSRHDLAKPHVLANRHILAKGHRSRSPLWREKLRAAPGCLG